MVPASISVARESPSGCLPSRGALKLANESPSHTIWELFKQMFLHWLPGLVGLHESTVRAESRSPTALWAS